MTSLILLPTAALATSSRTLALHVYEKAFKAYEMGYASSVSRGTLYYCFSDYHHSLQHPEQMGDVRRGIEGRFHKMKNSTARAKKIIKESC